MYSKLHAVGKIITFNRRLLRRAVLYLAFMTCAALPLVSQSQPAAPPASAQNAQSGSEPGANQGSQISESQLIGLPLNGRSYSQLATLQGGISDTSGASASRGTGGGSLNVVGGRSTSNSFLLDGTNIMNSENRVPRSSAGVQLGADTVLQVQVLSAYYGADNGRGSGGVLNSITRSGSPEFHGSLFEYFRNSKLDARNFFDGDEKPPFKRNQFGFTLTGPIIQDRTFFMAGFEAMRDRLSEANIDYYPDANARLGIITDSNGNLPRDQNGNLIRVPVSDKVAGLLKVIPIPQLLVVGRGMAEYQGVRFLPTDEDFLTFRVDHKISDRDSLFARYTFDDAASVSAGGPVDFTTLNNSRQQYITLVESHIFSTSLLTSLRASYTRPVINSENLSPLNIPPSVYFVPGAIKFGNVRVPGMTGFGPNQVAPEQNVGNTFQISGDILLEQGRHSLKTGVEVHRYRWETESSWNKGGSWSFSSLENFLAGSGVGTNLTVALPGSDNRRSFRQTLTGLYLQDSYRLRPDLQANFGLRYEFATLINDTHGLTGALPDPFRDSQVLEGPYLDHNPSAGSFAPRFGITWAPGALSNTVISAGFGIYYDHLLEYVIDARKNTAPFFNVAVRQNFDSRDSFPNAVIAAQSATNSRLVQVLDYSNLTNPRVMRYNFSLQNQFAGSWRAQASYVGARGNHLFRSFEMNLSPAPIVRADGSLFFPAYCGEGNLPACAPGLPDNRRNPAFGAISMLRSDAQSFYNSMQLSLNKRTSRGDSIQVSYTFSKSIDDASSEGAGAIQASSSSQYGLMRTLDRGLSDFDLRHRIVTSYFYNLPFGAGRSWLTSGPVSAILGGWRLGGILSYRTGAPHSVEVNLQDPGYLFSATRPNLKPGYSNNPYVGDRFKYFDTAAFSAPPKGTLGNLGRNTVVGPGQVTMDISLQKEFSLGGDRNLEFRAEIFNLPNHTNFNRTTSSTVVIFTGDPDTPRSSPNAGRLDQTATTARQVQFALRLSF